MRLAAAIVAFVPSNFKASPDAKPSLRATLSEAVVDETGPEHGADGDIEMGSKMLKGLQDPEENSMVFVNMVSV